MPLFAGVGFRAFGFSGWIVSRSILLPKLTRGGESSRQVLSVGKQICIDDGLISLTVKEIKGADVVCVVNNTAMLGETKVGSTH